MGIKRFANARSAATSPNNSDGKPGEDSTPIPSLHGNLVRNRYRRDPLEFYEPLEPLGEGSMGSVFKVRKRNEKIGGSARPEFVKSRGHKSFFCPLPRQSSSSSLLDYGSNTAETKIRNGGNCFSLFCWPAPTQPKLNVLHSMHEADFHFDQKSPKEGLSFWARFFSQPLFGKRQQLRENNSESSPDTSYEDDPLNPADYEQIEHDVKRALKHSSSSIIKYGHKDVVYALKSIHLDRVSSSDFTQELKNEVAILKELDHPHIVKCYETFNFRGSLFLVLEICSGSDLYTRDPYSEQDACTIIRSLLSAVAYMHSKQITHRDLKYENIMFASPDPDAAVKIIDFGLSKKYASHHVLHDTVGTVYTMAPELLKGEYTEVVDVWSLGVISFMLLSSSMPFYGKDRKKVIKKIMKGQYYFIGRRWKTVSADAKKFVLRLLLHNPEQRPSAAQALEDPWLMRRDFDPQGFAPEVALMDKVQACIQTFAGYGNLKKLALMLIAYRCTSEEIGYLRKMFDRFDLNHDGEVSLEEFKTVLSDYEYTDLELEGMFRAMDLDRTGMVTYSGFLAATIEAHGSINEEQVAECFDVLDNDDSGFISKEDIKEFLGVGIPQSYIEGIMAEADLNHDNKISYKEFLGLWDRKTDAKMRKDQEDVKKRRHRRGHSSQSNLSIMSGVSFMSEFSDDEFDELAIHPALTLSFKENEIAQLLAIPDTPVSGKRISAMSAFVLEKERPVIGGSGTYSTRRMTELASSPPGVNAFA